MVSVLCTEVLGSLVSYFHLSKFFFIMSWSSRCTRNECHWFNTHDCKHVKSRSSWSHSKQKFIPTFSCSALNIYFAKNVRQLGVMCSLVRLRYGLISACVWAVGPDVWIKRSPSFTESCPKISHSNVYY